ncbi:hypothetical protein BC936DRAFT_138882 [Jimgerdemannia flammicorona]|uniref:Uncharacterized protein n=1 Tax=Jimgerdemannia flammicorona TaxID=994334 RepID=A0A433BF34_9FUNG|nr:hypothetical protein BC936DRAFT_138882 [Jimgerdemannia flammicorona]
MDDNPMIEKLTEPREEDVTSKTEGFSEASDEDISKLECQDTLEEHGHRIHEGLLVQPTFSREIYVVQTEVLPARPPRMINYAINDISFSTTADDSAYVQSSPAETSEVKEQDDIFDSPSSEEVAVPHYSTPTPTKGTPTKRTYRFSPTLPNRQKPRYGMTHTGGDKRSIPQMYSIIRCGEGIATPKWLHSRTYKQLQRILCKPYIDHFEPVITLFESVVTQSTSPAMAIGKARAVQTNTLEETFMINVIEQFVFRADAATPMICTQETTYAYQAIWPVIKLAMQGLQASNLGTVEFVSGEKILNAIVSLSLKYHGTDDWHKADGVVFTSVKKIEILVLEMTGPHSLHDVPRMAWDHVKGYIAGTAMISYIAKTYPYAPRHLLERIKIIFLHTHESVISVYSIYTPSEQTFIIQRLAKVAVPSNFAERFELYEFLNTMWMVRRESMCTVSALNEMARGYIRNNSPLTSTLPPHQPKPPKSLKGVRSMGFSSPL